MFQANVTSAVALMDAAEEQICTNCGSIVLTSSLAATVPAPRAEAYCIAKAALECLARNRALRYAPDGVRVNVIQPGTLDTPAFRRSATASGRTGEEHREALAAKHFVH
ncbi:hypothetical protein WJX73_008675 [Symbiochloris irregularis]|uniref:Uncharacterized protein n=1 Tax=Symbiochloris irregularis TaxID=706552 RepID=A0AAW1PS42_9CHLO